PPGWASPASRHRRPPNSANRAMLLPLATESSSTKGELARLRTSGVGSPPPSSPLARLRLSSSRASTAEPGSIPAFPTSPAPRPHPDLRRFAPPVRPRREKGWGGRGERGEPQAAREIGPGQFTARRDGHRPPPEPSVPGEPPLGDQRRQDLPLDRTQEVALAG